MEESNPYQSPSESFNAPPELPPQKVPASIMVFGILHLVFGILGIFGALFAFISVFSQGAMMGGGLIDQKTMDALDQAKGWTLTDAGLKTILAVLLISSGIFLMKKRYQGLKLSNIYSFLSIAHKIYAILVFFLITWPIMQNMFTNMPGMDETAMKVTQGAGMVGGAIGILLALVYPILALILLNRDHVKAALN